MFSTALYTTYAAVLISGIAGAVFTDDVLRKRYFSILFFCTCTLFSHSVITLSKHCKLRRKTDAIYENVAALCGPNLESDDGQVQSESSSRVAAATSYLVGQIFDCTDFLYERRPIYGNAVHTAMLFAIFEALTCVFKSAEDWRIGSDPWAAQMLLAFTALYLLAIAIIVFCHEQYEQKVKFSYEPFDENVEIPMNVYVPKLVSVLMTGQFNIFVGLIIQLVSIIILVIVCDEKSIAEVVQVSKNQHTTLIILLTILNIGVLFCLIRRFVEAHETAKKYLLGTFEQNWQRNLKAYAFLLPEMGAYSSLEDLRLVLLEKFSDYDLTDEEKRVVDYIKIPLWETKKAFVDTREDVFQAEDLVPLRQNESPNRAPEVHTPPRPQEPALQANGCTPPPPRVSPPMTRSRAAKREQQGG